MLREKYVIEWVLSSGKNGLKIQADSLIIIHRLITAKFEKRIVGDMS